MSVQFEKQVLGLTEAEQSFRQEILETIEAYLGEDEDAGRLVQIAIAVISHIVAAGTPSDVSDEVVISTANACFRENYQMMRHRANGGTVQ